MDTVVIYPGRFHPFHKGHKSVYDTLVKRFGKDRVYIATSNKVDPPKSPFTFDEKRAMMALTGVDPSRVVQTKNPYQATEITDNFDPQNTTALFAVSDKDMAEDPRFSFKPKKDGSPSYYQPAQKDMRPMSEHGYIITVPTLQFNVLGKPMRSASEFRANFAGADSETQKAMITDLFGRYDPKTHSTMSQKINEQLVRADQILDQLIELGADDCYILEACIRVDTLVESINMKQRKQTLYQAIMEGGHSLPVMEAELACPLATQDLAVNTENRDRTIKQFNYGPLNVDVPGDYWKDIGEYWNTSEEAALASNCGACVAFDISERMKDCLPGDTFDDDGELGYCWMHHFKCHSARSCHTWAKGGPIKTEKESAEWQGKAFGGQGVKENNAQAFKQGAKDANKLAGQAVTMHSKADAAMANSPVAKTQQYKDYQKTNMDNKRAAMKKGMPYGRQDVPEEITDFNKEDPMNSVIAIRGIGTMSISSALREVSEMAANISNLAKVKDAKGIQDNFDRYMSLLNAYNTSIQEAYSELAQQRKRGGTASKGIDKDISEVMDQDRLNKFLGKKDDDDESYKKELEIIPIGPGSKRKGSRPPLDFDYFGDFNEHCGDPMADDHKPMRMLLMKLYDKEMQCQPGSPEHFEVMQMIDGCRKNIGLSEGFMDIITKPIRAVVNKTKKDYKDRKRLFGKGKPV